MFLSGSRFFQMARPDSDWDYVAQDTPEMRAALADAGYQCRQDTPERFCRQVWRLDTGLCVIEVKLVADEHAAHWMQKWIAGHPGRLREMQTGTRADKHALWEAAHRVYRSRMSEYGTVHYITVTAGSFGLWLVRRLAALKLLRLKSTFTYHDTQRAK